MLGKVTGVDGRTGAGGSLLGKGTWASLLGKVAGVGGRAGASLLGAWVEGGGRAGTGASFLGTGTGAGGTFLLSPLLLSESSFLFDFSLILSTWLFRKKCPSIG